jgi:hypothetical protein
MSGRCPVGPTDATNGTHGPAHVPSRRTAAARSVASWIGATFSHLRVNGRRRITGSRTANCGASIPATNPGTSPPLRSANVPGVVPLGEALAGGHQHVPRQVTRHGRILHEPDPSRLPARKATRPARLDDRGGRRDGHASGRRPVHAAVIEGTYALGRTTSRTVAVATGRRPSFTVAGLHRTLRKTVTAS